MRYSRLTYCMGCSYRFKDGDVIFDFTPQESEPTIICMKCSERKIMSNIKITAEVDGKQVPLETISIETFEAIKALEKPKEIPVARLVEYCHNNNEPRLLFRPRENIRFEIGKIYSLDLRRGMLAGKWEQENDEFAVGQNYHGSIKPL